MSSIIKYVDKKEVITVIDFFHIDQGVDNWSLIGKLFFRNHLQKLKIII